MPLPLSDGRLRTSSHTHTHLCAPESKAEEADRALIALKGEVKLYWTHICRNKGDKSTRCS